MSDQQYREMQKQIEELEEQKIQLEFQVASLKSRISEEGQALQRQKNELRIAYLGTIQTISRSIEAKDPYTKGHSELVTKYSMALAQELKYPWDRMEKIQIAAMLLDVGKIGIPRTILLKTTPLSAQEQQLLQSHVEIGAKILEPVVYPWDISTLVYEHHERLDGSGYPRGLTGKAIGLESRILGLVDSFCAMITDRAYRGAFTREQAVSYIRENSGTLFDPQVVAAFDRLLERDEEVIFRDLGDLVSRLG